ncbi:hypothetical protein MNBD_BACTEROID03-1089 [hydrothermal vent metagenome]|uniref:Uncharacterized protein n=1 Tax=hydrothermal vent metagenome TaxID=652676 RepID=A0A3B0T000_9ZZZZ
MVLEENQVKHLILKVFQTVIDFLLHNAGLRVRYVILIAIDKNFRVQPITGN